MSWDKQTSLDRIQKRWDARDKEVTVTKLTREMNLENVTLHNGRLIRGAHIYATTSIGVTATREVDRVRPLRPYAE